MHIHITYTKECLKSEGNSLGTLEDLAAHVAIWESIAPMGPFEPKSPPGALLNFAALHGVSQTHSFWSIM